MEKFVQLELEFCCFCEFVLGSLNCYSGVQITRRRNVTKPFDENFVVGAEDK